MKKILSLVVAYFVFVTQAFALTNVPDSTHWVAAGYGGGGTFSMMVPDHFTEGKIYAVSDVGSPLVSTDRGDNWTWLSYKSTNGFNATLPAAIIQSKNDANLMYEISGGASYQRRILKSTDGGQNWVSKTTAYGASRPSSGRVLAFDPTDDDTVYVGSNNGTLARTTDGGTTWTNLATSVFGGTNLIRWIYVNPTGTKVFMGNKNYAGGGGGLKVYDVNTQTVSSITLAPTTVSAYTAYKDLVSDYGTFIDGSNVENLCVATGIQIACTADEGANWTYTSNVTTPGSTLSNTRYINRLAVKRLASGQLRFLVYTLFNQNDGTSGSFGRVSNDSGATWSTFTLSRDTAVNPTFFGTSNSMPESLREDPFDEDVFYLATSHTMFRSDNGGTSFTEKSKGAQQTVATDVKVSPNGILIACHMDMGCQKSSDHGVTWVNMIPKTPFSEPGVAYPGGHFWKFVLSGDEDDWNAGNGHIIITSNYWYDRKPRIHRSVDNGDNFTTITAGLPTAALFGDCVWGSSGCYFRALSISPLDENVIYGAMDGSGTGGNGGLFKSTDNGVTWSRVWTLPNRVYNALAVDPKDATAQKLLLGTTLYNLYQKTGASTSNYVGSPDGPSNFVWDAVYDSNGRPYVGTGDGGAGIYKSVVTAYGNGTGSYGTWELMHRFPTTSSTLADGLLVDPGNNNRVFVTTQNGPGGSVTGNRVFMTADAQNHKSSVWYDITGDLPSIYGCQALTIDPNEGTQGFLYCASPGNGLFKLDLADSPTVNTGTMCIGCSP